MSDITLVSQNFYKELSASPSNYLLGNVGDKIRIETTISVAIYAIGSSTNPFTLNATDGYVGAGWVVGFGSCFQSFNVGDTVEFWNQTTSSGASYTIVAKQSDFEIQLNTTIPVVGNDYQISAAIFSVSTPITAIRYQYNFINNSRSDSFLSSFDRSDQLWIASDKLASDATTTNMTALGLLTWQSGSVTITGISAGLVNGIYTSQYIIKHYTKIPPYLVYQQPANALNNISPQTTNCWKFITQIDAMELYSNPNIIFTTDFDSVLGNTGGFNSNFSTGNTNYSIAGLSYTNGGNPITSIQLDNSETTITFLVNNNTDTPFSNNNTKFVVGIFKIPADPTEYQGNNKLLDQNFLFDRALQTVGSATINGDNYGSIYQILKGVTGTFINSGQISITCKINMAAAVISAFQASSDPQYFLFVTTQNYNYDTENPLNDLVTLQVDLNTFFVVTADPGMITIGEEGMVILRHPEWDGDAAQGTNTLDCYPEDELVAYLPFFINSAGRTADTILLTSVIATVEAFNLENNKSFQLDRFTSSLQGIPLTGFVQQFDNKTSRGFHVPANSIRKYFEVQRRNDLDNGSPVLYGFSMKYAFIFRWETWIAATGIDPSFLNTALPNNGLNENWIQYNDDPWVLKVTYQINATKNGIQQQYSGSQIITPHNYNSNANYMVKTCLPFTATSLAAIQSGAGGGIQINSGGSTFVIINGQKYYTNGTNYTPVYGGQKILIAAVFTKTTNIANNLTIIIDVEVYQQGGIYGKRRYSSKWVADADTWFSSIDGSGKIVAINTGKSVVGLCYFDPTTLNFPTTGVTSWSFSPRIYEFGDYVPGLLQTDSGIQLQTDDGQNLQVDGQ